MTKTPTQEQRDDAAFLVSHKWGALFSEPGTGKTLTAITARKALPADLKTLVIAPKIALTQWQKELLEQGIEAHVLRAGKDFRLMQFEQSLPVMITTWALMTDNAAAIEAWGPEIIIADESHACIDYKSQRTQAFFGGHKNDVPVATGAEWTWLLTGTPTVRFNDDLWPMLNALFPDTLVRLVGNRRRASFVQRYVRTRPQRIPGGRVISVPCGGQNEVELNDALYGEHRIAIRRKLADVDRNLPTERYRDIDIDLSDFDDSALKGMTNDDLAKKFETEEVKSVRRAFGRAKVAGAVEYLQTIDEPVLVLTWHQDVTDALEEAMPESVKIDGRTSLANRELAMKNFADGSATKLIGQIGAVGTALDGLQHVCKRVVFVERIGSPALMEQAIARVVRRGQQHSVQVETLRANHRLEHVTDATLAAKTETQQKAVG